MSGNHGKQSLTKTFCDKISCLIWTKIKENGNSMKMNTIQCIHLSLHALNSMNFVETLTIQCSVKTGKQFQNSTKLPRPNVF